MEDKEKLYEKAMNKWGKNAQIMMLFEEMAELQRIVCHQFRSEKRVWRYEIVEEIADVYIMLEQLMVMMHIRPDEVVFEKIKKLQRLQERLNEG